LGLDAGGQFMEIGPRVGENAAERATRSERLAILRRSKKAN
jgi:hypothetical protein